jgi:SAM-dependent methyltransferase
MKLYGELAEWWPLMSPPDDYAEEAVAIARLLRGSPGVERPRLLELGSGGGHLASHLKLQFEMTLADLSPRMLELSQALNPECRHLKGDMRTLRLGESFDAVLIHDAVSHLDTTEDLEAALHTARAHLRPGGVGVFCPDYTVECFSPGTTHGGTDGPERGMRYIEWTQPEITGTTYRTDIVYLLRTAKGPLRIEHDSVMLSVFTRAQWTDELGRAAFGEIAIETISARDVFAARAA